MGAQDMSGNVWEWVSDWYGENAYTSALDTNPTGPETGDSKVLRGGYWYSASEGLRSTNRARNVPVNRFGHNGIRCAAPGK